MSMFISDKLSLSSEREYTPEGFLKVPARISRIGVQDYLASELGVEGKNPDDRITVYRPESEVFDENSLKTFASKPVTNNHPAELVTSENFKNLSVGFSGESVHRDGMFAKTILNITDADAIKAIQSGKVELSNGYTADIDWTPGVTDDGIKYDAVQRNIQGNHIAIVDRARAGYDCRLADSLENIEGKNMAQVTIEGIDFDVSDQVAQAIDKLMIRLNEAEAQVAANESDDSDDTDSSDTPDTSVVSDEPEDTKKQDPETATLQAKLDDAISKIPSLKKLDILVEKRIKLIDSARKIVPNFEWQGKSESTICRQIVALKCPGVKISDVSAEYVKARFDILVDSIADTNQIDYALSTQLQKNQTTIDNRSLSTIAREKMIADSRNAWKTRGNK